METFTRNDGCTLQVVQGFREQVLSYRPSVTPKPKWSDEDYSAAAHKKLKRWRRWLIEFSRWRGTLDGAEVLDVGCGDGINCLLVGLQSVRRVVGIDLQLPLFERGERGGSTRRLACTILEKLALGVGLDEVLSRLPVRFAAMDATLMTFPDDSFDSLISRSAMEHITPVEKALTEMARVVRPGGLIHHSIDPYFWLRGCHKTGLVDIPWAHARLSLEEFRRFVIESEGESIAAKRCRRLETLNRFTLRQWRERIEAGPFETLEWKEERSSFAETLLEKHPDVGDTLLDGVDRRDLVHGRIEVWLRKKACAPPFLA